MEIFNVTSKSRILSRGFERWVEVTKKTIRCVDVTDEQTVASYEEKTF